MAVAFLERWEGALAAAVAAGTAGAVGDDRCEWFSAGHPVPTEHSERAGRRVLELAARTEPDDVLLLLLSGGASACLAVPIDNLTLADKVAATRALLRGGVPIDGINCVRKHLSAIKGGRLALATPGAVLTLAISDVVGPVPDDPAVIGSGPTAGDPTTFADAIAVSEWPAVRPDFPAAARRVLDRGSRGQLRETPAPGDPGLANLEPSSHRERRRGRQGRGRRGDESGIRRCDDSGAGRRRSTDVGRRPSKEGSQG